MNRNNTITTLSALTLLCGVASAQPGTSSWKILLADHTGDGVVDAADYTVWRNSLGDCNRDGVVDSQDYAVWRQNFGGTGSSAGADNFDPASDGGPITPTPPLAWGAISQAGAAATDHEHKDWIPILSTSSGLAGDYNDDGVVDAADYTVWRENLGTSVSLEIFLDASGDFNGDSVVDAADYLLWRQNFGTAAPGAAPSGDYNGDSVVDAADYTVWRDQFGTAGSSIPSGPRHDLWWSASPPCPADVNADGVLDNGDIGAFIQLFLAGDPAADLNGDSILDNGDINAFIAAFLAGC